jgi:type I restriction enzyme S subunit
MSKIKIDHVFNIEKGKVQSSKNTPGKFTFITAAEEWKTHNDFSHDCEAIIFAAGAEGSLGRTHYVNGKFIASDLCFIMTPKKDFSSKIDLEFYYYYFNAIRKKIVKDIKTGTSKKAINQKKFKDYEIIFIEKEKQIKIKNNLKIISKLEKIINELQLDIETVSSAYINKIIEK